MAEWLEACMVICFGISWPMSIRKSCKARTAKGKSLVFLVMIWLGYVCGILSKIVSGRITYVFVFYCLNFLMLIVELLLYVRNSRLDNLVDNCSACQKRSQLAVFFDKIKGGR